MLTIDIVSHIYPTKHDLSSGIFIQKEARLLTQKHNLNIWIPSVRAFPWQQQAKRSINPVSEKFSVKRIKYWSVPRRKLPSFTLANLSRVLIKNLGKSHSDIIHLHWLFPTGLCIPRIKKVLKKPILLTLHGGDWYSNINSGLKPLIEKSLTEADAIICVGNQLKNDILTIFPHLLNKTFHVPHGIDCTKYTPVSGEYKKELQHIFSWDTSKVHILCVANFYEAKGVEILVEAYAKLPPQKNICLHLIAPRRDIVIEKKIHELISQFSLSKTVYLYPSLSETELIKKYQAADFLVSPSKKEGFGLAVAEAIACGIPVVATKSGGPQEIINNSNGKLVNVDDINALRNTMIEMIENYQDYSSYDLHNSIMNRFGLETKLEQLSTVYEQLT